jgi:hypothetical protein
LTEAVQNGRIYIELINAQYLKAGGTPGNSEPHLIANRKGLARPARERHLREVHRRGRGAVCLTYVKALTTTAAF